MKRNTSCAQEAFLEANRVILGGVKSITSAHGGR